MTKRNRLAATYLWVVSLAGCSCERFGLFGCETIVLTEVRAPGGTLKAVVFERNCGATTPFSVHVSLLPVDRRLPNESGNVFTCVPYGDYRSAITVTWVNAGDMRIRANQPGQVHQQHPSHSGVRITYEFPP